VSKKRAPPREEYVKRYHRDCGGEIINRKCLKCDKTWGRVRYYLSGDIEEVPHLRHRCKTGDESAEESRET